jgi:hypothetical protein
METQATPEIPKYKTPLAKRHALNVYREDKRYFSLRLNNDDYSKLCMLCSFAGSQKKGTSYQGILLSLFLERLHYCDEDENDLKKDKIVSHVDTRMRGLLLKHTGLLKHASNVFFGNIEINTAMNLINKAMDRIDDFTTPRQQVKHNIIVNDGKTRKIRVYFSDNQHSLLVRYAGAMTLADYLRGLLRSKTITSRYVIEDYHTILEAGKVIAEAVVAEQNRQNRSDGSKPSTDIVRAIGSYKNTLQKILGA